MADRRELDLDAWLAPFLDVMGRKTRRTWAPLYLRGLLGPGERKSLQPMAARLGLSGHDQLQHFIASPAWDDGPLATVLAHEADRLVGGSKAYLVIDDTALPKQGKLSVGVARQYCGQLGKRANCQSLVTTTLAQDEVPVMVGLHLFLPDEWTGSAQRCDLAGVPEMARKPRTKGEIALAEVDRLLGAGVRFGTVLADAGYGRVQHSAKGSRHAASNGLWASRATRRSTAPRCNLCCLRDAPARWCQTSNRARPKWCWQSGRGERSPGAMAPRAALPPGSPRCASGSVMARSGPTTNTCPDRKFGWSENYAPAESANTI